MISTIHNINIEDTEKIDEKIGCFTYKSKYIGIKL